MAIIIMFGISVVGVIIAATTKAIKIAYRVLRSRKGPLTRPMRARIKIRAGISKITAKPSSTMMNRSKYWLALISAVTPMFFSHSSRNWRANGKATK